MEKNWKYKSLVNLQKMMDFVPNANPPTRLVRRCEELLQIPLNEYSVEDLRIMIGQEFGLEYLIPLAIEKLQDDLFAEGDYYPGDLLQVILNTKRVFWEQHQPLYEEIENLIRSRRKRISILGIPLGEFDNNI